MSLRAIELMRQGKIKPGRGIGQLLETKKGGKFKTRSSYETKYAIYLDDDPGVIKFTYEPFTIEYEHEGIIKHYIPDFLVFRNNKIELVEVKPSKLINMDRNPAKFRAARRYCVDNELDFVMITEQHLKSAKIF